MTLRSIIMHLLLSSEWYGAFNAHLNYGELVTYRYNKHQKNYNLHILYILFMWCVGQTHEHTRSNNAFAFIVVQKIPFDIRLKINVIAFGSVWHLVLNRGTSVNVNSIWYLTFIKRAPTRTLAVDTNITYTQNIR